MYRCALFFLTAVALINISECKTKNYDNFDVESVLSNQERSKKFFECVRNESNCSQDDKELKMDLMEMMTTGCKDCTPAEKNKLEDVKRRAMNDPSIMTMALGENAQNA